MYKCSYWIWHVVNDHNFVFFLKSFKQRILLVQSSEVLVMNI